MPRKNDSLIGRLLHRGVMRRWERAVGAAASADLETMRGLRVQARQLRRRLDQFLHVAEGRLALPVLGSNAMNRPFGADWTWRPQLWRGPVSPIGQAAVPNRATFGDEASIFHDCTISELTFRQVRNTRDEDLAPFGVRLDVFRFDGSFLSMVIDLPDEAIRGLRRTHLVRLEPIVELEKPLEIFARLNVRHGPNTEQVVRELPFHEGNLAVDFDLGYTRMNEKRIEKAWLDLIFEGPEMNQIVIRDITMSRRPRSEI